MQKRNARQYVDAMRVRVDAMRRRGLRSMRGRVLPEPLRESHAREFVIRSWLVPSFKSKLGAGLKTIIIPGSVQRGVRQASLKRKKSDIDVSVVVADECLHDAVTIAAVVEAGIKEFMGVETNVHVFPRDIFVMNEMQHPNKAFQVVYGRKWLENEFGKGFDKDFDSLRELYKKYKPKYR